MESAKVVGATEVWQVGRSLTGCFQYILENELHTDVSFHVVSPGIETPTKVSAHKLLLRTRSPVFEAMFNGNFAEAYTEEPIKIHDIKLNPFKEMLKFIYTGEAILTGSNVMHVLYASKKYMLKCLTQKCLAYLETGISAENVGLFMSQSMFYGEHNLVIKCYYFIMKNAEDVLKSKGLRKMSQPALFKVIASDCLPPGIEDIFFEAILGWGIENTEESTDEEIRDKLGECLHQVRFVDFEPQLFAKKFGSTSVLTDKEKNLIFCWLLTRDADFRDQLINNGFNMKSRICQLYRFSTPRDALLAFGESPKEIFTISANKTVYICGLLIYAGEEGANMDISVFVVDRNNTEISKKETTLKSAGADFLNMVMFDTVHLNPNTAYQIIVSLKTPKCRYGKSTIVCSEVNGVTFKMQTNAWPFVATDGSGRGYVN